DPAFTHTPWPLFATLTLSRVFRLAPPLMQIPAPLAFTILMPRTVTCWELISTAQLPEGSSEASRVMSPLPPFSRVNPAAAELFKTMGDWSGRVPVTSKTMACVHILGKPLCWEL